MAFPVDELDVTVRMAFGADLTADPDTWDFTDMSARLVDSAITISRGAASGGQPTAGSCDLDLRNDDGELSPDRAESSLFPLVEQDVPIEILAGPADSERFAGFAVDYRPTFVPTTTGEPVSVMHIGAAGIMRRLTQAAKNKALGSPLRRTMSGITAADVVPLLYLPGEDGSASTQVASGLPNGTPGLVSGSVSFAANSDLAGSSPLLTLAAGASISAAIPIYTDIGKWFFNLAINVPSEPGVQTILLEVRTTGGTIAFWRLLLTPGSPSQLEWQAYDAAGVALVDVNEILAFDGSGGGKPTEAEFYGSWFMLVLGSVQRSASVVGASAGITNGTVFPSVGGFQNTGTHSVARSIRITAAAGTAGFGIGHLGLFVDSAFAEASGSNQNVSAMLGHAGETTVDRWNRLLTEQGVHHSVTGTSDTTMGPQSVDATLLDLIGEINDAEQGAITEKRFGLNLVCRSAQYNLPVGLAVDLSTYRTATGSTRQVLAPTYSDQGYRNEWTVERTDGSFAIAQATAAEIARRGLYDEAITANLSADTDLAQHASWRLQRDLLNRVRYPDTPIDVGENNVVDASFMADWFALELGAARIQRTNVPGLHGAGVLDELLGGYSERLERKRLTVTYNGPPYAPYVVAELDDDVLAKLDTDGSDLTAAVNSSATALSVATQTGTSPLWPTDAGEMPIPLIVAGEVMSATAIAAPTTVTFGAAGTASHASNASVTPGIPASVATGNLLLCLAAIRNSGTGVPDTPSGYTRLEVFASTDNVQLFAKVATSSGEVAPTVTFTGGVANATTSAQMCRIAGAFSTPAEAFVIAATQLNASAQDIGYPCLALTRPQLDTTINNAIVVYLGWKQDDWTSVAAIAGATEIGEPSSTTGDDQGLVWDYTIQTTATDIVPGSFTVTGGAGAISRGAVVAIRSNIQAVTVTRSVNGVVKAQVAGEAVNVHKPARLAL